MLLRPVQWVLVTLLVTLLVEAHIPHQLKWNRLRRHRDNEKVNAELLASGQKPLSEKWFTQKLSHFDDSVKKTWKQRYWQNDEFVKNGGNLNFLNIGGEGEESPAWIQKADLPAVIWAKKLGARFWNVEHRFYGQSKPTSDMSTKNLKYLDSRQALADLAEFIKAKNQELKIKDPKWIVFGGSYPGALVLWFRQQYKDLTVGGVGSSAPVELVTDMYDYLRVCEDSYTTYNKKCAQYIQEGFKALQNELEYKEGRDRLDQAFGFKPPLAQQNLSFIHLQNAYSAVMGNFMVAVQYSRVNAGIFKYNASIPDVCRVLNEPAFNPIARLVKVNKYMSEAFKEDPDHTYINYESDVKYLSNPSWDSYAADSRAWTWQTCNEFGYFQSTGYNGIFGVGVPVDFYYNLCTDVFGSDYNVDYTQQKVRESVEHYGRAKDYNGTNVVIPNGSLDPWHALGTYSQNNPSAVPYLITGTAHCADMEPASSNDPEGLKKVRDLIFSKLQEWSGVKASELRANRVALESNNDVLRKQKQEIKKEARIAPEFDAEIILNAKESILDVDQNVFLQRIDHFDDLTKDFFKQTYMTNKKYYKKGGPIFLRLTHNKANPDWIQDEKLPFVQAAKNFNAFLILLEQRFYGDSQPTGTIDPISLEYLTIEQSLGDIAALIRAISKEEEYKDAKWIVYGGDYAGALAAWMRKLYPDLVYGAITSGAPYLAQLDFYGHYQSIQETLQQFDNKCYNNLKKALDQVHYKLTTVEGRNELNDKLKLDPKFSTDYVDPYDLFTFYQNLLNYYATEVAFGDDLPIDIKFLCDAMNNEDEKDLIKRLFSARWETGVNTKYAWQLLGVGDETVLSNEARLRFWFQCNEFGQFTTTNIGYNIFGSGLPINYFLRLCNDAFDTNYTRDQLDEKILATNAKYGGTENFKSSRIVNLYGSYDPWRKLALYPVNGDHGEDVVTILIKGSSHCSDMEDPDKTKNPQNVKDALVKVNTYLTKWLK